MAMTISLELDELNAEVQAVLDVTMSEDLFGRFVQACLFFRKEYMETEPFDIELKPKAASPPNQPTKLSEGRH